jgi:hypothetical protein
MSVVIFPLRDEQQISVSNPAFSRVLGRLNHPIAPNQVAVHTDGTVFVVYEAPGGLGVFGRIVSPDGTMSSEILVDQGGPVNAPHSASVATDGNYFIVVWRREGQGQIQAQLYSPNGQPRFPSNCSRLRRFE